MRPTRTRSSLALLAVLAGLLASPCVAGAQSITSWSPDEHVTVRLADGRRLEGRYRGTVGSATDAPYAGRYAAWLDDVGPTSAPALGETLLVEHGQGGPLRGVFVGFADGQPLLATGDSCSFLVAWVNGNDVRRTDEPAMDSDWIAARGLWKSAPAPYVVIIETDSGSLAVQATAIVSSMSVPECTGSQNHGSGGGDGAAGAVAAGVILGVLIGGLLAYVAVGAAFASAFSHLLI